MDFSDQICQNKDQTGIGKSSEAVLIHKEWVGYYWRGRIQNIKFISNWQTTAKELSFCHKLGFLNSNFFKIKYR